MIACFLSNISAKYYKNPSMLSRVIAKNVGDVFFETQCSYILPIYVSITFTEVFSSPMFAKAARRLSEGLSILAVCYLF